MKTMSIRNVSLYTWYKEWDMVKHIRVLPGIVDKNTQIWWLWQIGLGFCLTIHVNLTDSLTEVDMVMYQTKVEFADVSIIEPDTLLWDLS